LLEPFPPSLRVAIREALAYLDRVALEQLALPTELQAYALQLFDLRGEPEQVLQTVSQFDLADDARAAVNHLKSVIMLLREVAQTEAGTPPKAPIPLTLDLSLVQPFDYYTGLVFEVVTSAETGCRVLGQGGRYDNLLGVFQAEGKGYPGVGFMLQTEALHQALLPTGLLPQEIPASDWLVVPTMPQTVAAAFTYAKTLRAATSLVRAEVHLTPFEDADTVRQLAHKRRIDRIAWIGADGTPEIEALEQTRAERQK
jgi:ATP phosphoribosyltransferase regulatory subunit